ncbi:inositol-pentakisphosphate 2-kinase isoform X1 [Lactuca sativa]|uniref:inositol-pentakisphosphate 2-kinase isoform X1 n=1 Tax=Lactuca sativa TaxID=4236 RepID=UPI000CD884C9|nr:inositol-pentakisphosphate 2-kinase isoform X1 [Lactuca sativa]XP_023741556.1 inositol-pentakisphosphate 2-kinase isoform X1 [Lactuca sativa]XP_023741557.1 inositol-pentakisphosphate 2-kinase isoform X1 [Lactuca sativa]
MMELNLNAKDAGDWIYRGEGAANIILSYSGSTSDFVGKVLRVQKVKRNGTNYEEVPSDLSVHEGLFWNEDCDLLSAPTREIAEHLYVQHVMSPRLGSNHVDAGVRVLVSRDFLEAVAKNVFSQRPSWRVTDADVNTQCDYALLISDHSVFPQALRDEEFSISVEIKPKCGFLPCSNYILEEHTMKRCMTRFKLHQTFKLKHKKVSQLSRYDPLDMFSGSKERILKSIKDLFSTPQNNFRVFLNGSLVFGCLGGGKYRTNVRYDRALEDALKFVIQADDGMRTTCFLELVSEAVFRSGLLDRLLQVQKLDVFDIEGAIHAYYDVVSQPCVVCRELGEESDRYTSLHTIPLDESLKIVKEYLIAATAKDLSLMISFRTREKEDPKSAYNVILHESIGQSFDYKVSFIDLDMKPLGKMMHYYELDQKIVRCCMKMMKNEISANVEEKTSYQDKSIVVEDDYPTRELAGNLTHLYHLLLLLFLFSFLTS